MRKSRFSEEQIVGILQEHEAGAERTARSAGGTVSANKPSTAGSKNTTAWTDKVASG